MSKDKGTPGWWLLPTIFGIAFMAIGPFLVPIALMLIPAYIKGYSNLTVHYKLMALLSFAAIGLIANFIEIGRNKKDALYQLIWSFYVGAFIGFLSLLRAGLDDVDFNSLIYPGVFYGSYLIFSLLLIKLFHVKFQYFSWSTTKKKSRGPNLTITPETSKANITRIHNIEDRQNQAKRSAWNLLNPVFLFFFGWLFLFQWRVLDFGFWAVHFLIPSNSFLVFFPDDGPHRTIWTGVYLLGGMFASIPILLMFVNLAEMLIPWARKAFTKEGEYDPRRSFKGAMKYLFGAAKWMSLPILPFMFFGLLHFYYFDPSGVHLFQWPNKTVDYSWSSLKYLEMEAWGSQGDQTNFKMQYRLVWPSGMSFDVNWQYFEGPTDHEVAESYLGLSRILRNNPNLLVKTKVSPEGMVFLKQELGDDVKDLLIKP